ncbi:MAG: tRNA lysidine(34) synthetase TilS [Candidatus Kapabacteria bacterium]|nr:tRNA lysidine(34) synthetase TilS [Candidatus Kapabacteria bacterium]
MANKKTKKEHLLSDEAKTISSVKTEPEKAVSIDDKSILKDKDKIDTALTESKSKRKKPGKKPVKPMKINGIAVERAVKETKPEPEKIQQIENVDKNTVEIPKVSPKIILRKNLPNNSGIDNSIESKKIDLSAKESVNEKKTNEIQLLKDRKDIPENENKPPVEAAVKHKIILRKNIPEALPNQENFGEVSSSSNDTPLVTEQPPAKNNFQKKRKNKWNKKKSFIKEDAAADSESSVIAETITTGINTEDVITAGITSSEPAAELTSETESPIREKNANKNRRKKKKKNINKLIPGEDSVAALPDDNISITGNDLNLESNSKPENRLIKLSSKKPEQSTEQKVENQQLIQKTEQKAEQKPPQPMIQKPKIKDEQKSEIKTGLKTDTKNSKKPIHQPTQNDVVQNRIDAAKPVKSEKHKPEKNVPKKKTEIFRSQIPLTKQLTKPQQSNEFLVSFFNKVEDYLVQQAYIEPGGKLLVAVSGGVDSVVLMDALAILASKLRFTLYVAHFNHKLRGLSADNDEQLVRNMSKEYNLPFYSGFGNVKQYSSKNSISIEHAARILRYNYFERTARNLGVDIVSTAHTEDDLVETFFINLFRGSGLTGLSSMPSKRKFVKNVSLVRPFLQFNKNQLYEYANIRKLKWNEDETNSLLNYTRNKIRHDLIPKLVNEYNPALIDIINRTAELIQGADEVIKDLVSKSINSVLEESNNERFQLKINMLLTFNKFMQGELIQYAWSKYFRLQPLPLSAIDRILDLFGSITGSICEISSGYFVLRDRNNLIFAKRVKDIASTILIEKPGDYKIGKYKIEIRVCNPNEVKFSDDKNIEYIPAELMEPFVEIRSKKEGDDFHPLGSPGEMKLSDFLTNEKVSLVDKPNILVMTNRKEILWVLGYRISEKCRVSKSTGRIYKIKLINSDKK